MNLDKVKKVYLLGIGGIGVSAVAKYFLETGREVSGADLKVSDITTELEAQGVKIFYQHQRGNLDSKVDLVIYSSAVPETNPEFQQAQKLDIVAWSYFDFLAKLSQTKKTIVVSGTHGKSTTTSLIAMMMIKAGLDPTVFVGTKIKDLASNFRLGQSNYLLVEGCEYMANMLKLNADFIALPSVDVDHLDFYKDLSQIKDTFQKFIDKLERKSNLVYNGDDINIKTLKKDSNAYSVGLSLESDLEARNLRSINSGQSFDLYFQNQKIINIETSLPGRYNITNILVASALALKLGIKEQIIAQTIKEFKGLWRRFEIIGEWNSNLIISDYAHHPVELKSLLQGARAFYKSKKIVAVFQPHQEDRTQKLFNDFLNSFSDADEIIIYPIYEVAGRRSSKTKTSKDLAQEIKKHDQQNVYYLDSYEKIKNQLENYHDAIILIVGAGDIDNFGRHYLKIS